ncbi:alpha/beta fold hydrolase [Ekhidna sp.]|uniref:alpha/beta fold hydrolase n=1 Tax=Ekhidna sp. TaxID=2608089 RepID=UPI003B504905
MEKLLLIHGALGAADQMIPLKELLEKDFVVEIIEFEGHGGKSFISEDYSLDGFVSQLDQKIDNDESVHIFGYSMGGFIALISASQGNSNIKSITTLGTKMRWSPAIAEKEAKRLNPEKIEEKVPAFANALKMRHGNQWKKVLNRTAQFMRRLGENSPMTHNRMSAIKIPVQLCLADQDSMVSVEETEEVKRWLSNSRIEKIFHSKHPMEKTNLTALSQTIRSFIEQVN